MRNILTLFIFCLSVGLVNAQFDTPLPKESNPEPDMPTSKEEILEHGIKSVTKRIDYQGKNKFFQLYQYNKSGDPILMVSDEGETMDTTIFIYTDYRLSKKIVTNSHITEGIENYKRSTDESFWADTITYKYTLGDTIYEIWSMPYGQKPYVYTMLMNEQGNLKIKIQERGKFLVDNEYKQYNKQVFLLTRSNKTRFYYDDLGRLIRKTGESLSFNDTETKYYWNSTGQIDSMVTEEDLEGGKPHVWRTEYKYAGDQMTNAQSYLNGEFKDETDFDYYKNGLLKSEIFVEEDEPEPYKVIYIYEFYE